MKQLAIVLVLISPMLSFSQKVFEGKIIYTINNSQQDSFVVYYGPNKIRSEIYSAPFRNAGEGPYYFLSDSRDQTSYKISDSQSTVTMLIVDTPLKLESRNTNKEYLQTKR